MTLRIRTQERRPMYFEVGLEGRLDTNTYGQLERALDGIFSSPVRALQLDMGKLDYISSMGLRVVLMAMKRMKQLSGTFMMSNLQPQIKRVFDIAGMLPKEQIFTSVEEADAYFDLMQKKALAEAQGGPDQG